MNPEENTELPSASLIRRMMAMIYDAFLLLGITFAYGVVVFLLRKLFGDDTLQAPHGALQVFILLGLLLCWAFFYAWCWQRSGQTLGMKSWRIQLQAEDGSRPGWKTCWLRCLFAPLSLAAFGIGYFWCLFDKNGDCVHDKWSHSRTLLLPKPPKKKKT